MELTYSISSKGFLSSTHDLPIDKKIESGREFLFQLTETEKEDTDSEDET